MCSFAFVKAILTRCALQYSRGAVRHNVILAIDMNRGPVAFWITPVNVNADVFRIFV